MQRFRLYCFFFLSVVCLQGQAQEGPVLHPNTAGKGWVRLFNDGLTNAIYPKGVWSVTDSVLTATKDEAIWSEKAYDNFVLDLDFKNAPGTNSGVMVHASNTDDWIPHSVEIQIADDFADE